MNVCSFVYMQPGCFISECMLYKHYSIWFGLNCTAILFLCKTAKVVLPNTNSALILPNSFKLILTLKFQLRLCIEGHKRQNNQCKAWLPRIKLWSGNTVDVVQMAALYKPNISATKVIIHNLIVF